MSKDEVTVIDGDGEIEDASGQDIDIWGDGSPTRSTPIPEDWERVQPQRTQETAG